jgi:hypothetical protein
MAIEWHLAQGLELLVAHLLRGVTFTNLDKHPIPNNDIFDIGIWVIHCTGLFVEEYKAWIACGNTPTNTMYFTMFRIFYDTAITIALFTTILASQHSYGMNAA